MASLLKAVASTSAFTMLSRVTGLARDVVIAHQFGASGARDAFEVAFQLPNMLRRLFAEGAFAQAFVPFLARTQAAHGDAATRELVNKIAGVQLIALLAVTLLGSFVAPWIILAFASGFAQTPGKVELAAQMLRIMFPYLLFVSLVALAGGVMNTYRRFAIPAFTPVLLNLSTIFGALVLGKFFAQPLYGLAWGVFLGGVLQLTLQIRPLMKLGMVPTFDPDIQHPYVRTVLKGMMPALLGVSVAQISGLINMQYASHFGEGSVSWLKTADRLMELPTALLGVALGSVLLPSLSRLAVEAKQAEYDRLMDWGLRLALLLAWPAVIALAMLGGPIVSTLFQRGAFNAHDVMQTRYAVIAYAVGVLGLVWIKILAPGFYARGDLKRPVRIAIVALLTTQLVNFVTVFYLAPQGQRHAALALGTSLGALVNAALLWYFLHREKYFTMQSGWLVFVAKLLVAGAALAAVIAWMSPATSRWMAASQGLRALHLAGVILASVVAYFGALFAMGFRLKDFKR